MPHTISYNSKLHVVELTIRSELHLGESKEIIHEITRIIKTHRCYSILTDIREGNMQLSTVDIYELPKALAAVLASSGIDAYQLKRAIVTSTNSTNLDFFETVTSNNSQQVRLFQDIDTAKTWLLHG